MVIRCSTENVLVSFRHADGERSFPWLDVDAGTLGTARPWRTFRWYKGQKHYAGSFWSSTTKDLVTYESRLELARLLFADFDSSVYGIVAQPFLLTTAMDGVVRKHVPDFLLETDLGPVVVDVKPRRQLSSPETMFAFEWTRQAVTSRGWRYEVWSEPPPIELENVRLLAGYRRHWLFPSELLAELQADELDGLALRDLCCALPSWPAPVVRPAVFHLLWRQHFLLDLTVALTADCALRVAR
jgi:hypothetical protein